MDSLLEATRTVGVVAGALIAVGVVWAKGLKPMLKFVRAVVRTADSLESLVPVVRDIAIEFKPNDGVSLKDTIHRMDHNIHTNAFNVQSIHEMIHQGVEDAPVVELEPLIEPPDYNKKRIEVR